MRWSFFADVLPLCMRICAGCRDDPRALHRHFRGRGRRAVDDSLPHSSKSIRWGETTPLSPLALQLCPTLSLVIFMHRLCVYPPIFTVSPADYFPYYFTRHMPPSSPRFLTSLPLSLTPAQAVCGIWIRSGLRACAMTVSEHSSSLSSFVTRNPILLVPAPQNIRFEIDHFRGFPSFYSGNGSALVPRRHYVASSSQKNLAVARAPDVLLGVVIKHRGRPDRGPLRSRGYGTLPRCPFLGAPFSGSERAEGRTADNLDTQRTHIA